MKKFIENKKDLPASPATQINNKKIDIKNEIITIKDAESLYSRQELLKKLANTEINGFYYHKQKRAWHLIFFKDFEHVLFNSAKQMELRILSWTFGIGEGYLDREPFVKFNLLDEFSYPFELNYVDDGHGNSLIINIDDVVLLKKEIGSVISKSPDNLDLFSEVKAKSGETLFFKSQKEKKILRYMYNKQKLDGAESVSFEDIQKEAGLAKDESEQYIHELFKTKAGKKAFKDGFIKRIHNNQYALDLNRYFFPKTLK